MASAAAVSSSATAVAAAAQEHDQVVAEQTMNAAVESVLVLSTPFAKLPSTMIMMQYEWPTARFLLGCFSTASM